jgi:hypothetical protein
MGPVRDRGVRPLKVASPTRSFVPLPGGRRYQRSSWTIVARPRRPPARSGRVRSVGSSGYPKLRMYSQWWSGGKPRASRHACCWYTVAGHEPMPWSHAARVMFWAARPRSHMTERGCPGALGSGVTSAMASAAPATWPHHGPSVESRSSIRRSRTTTKDQRWRFLDEPVRRPASRMVESAAAGIGSVENRRLTRWWPMASRVCIPASMSLGTPRGGIVTT